MNRLRSALCLLSAAALVGLAGCGGGPSGPNVASALIHTQTYIGGVLQAWPGAILYGNAVVGTYNCVPYGTDYGCIVAFADQTTDANGDYILKSEALPAEWDIAAQADQNCSTGASWANHLSPSLGATLTCGQLVAGSLTVTPDLCWTIINYEIIGGIQHIVSEDDECPATLELSTAASTFPTTYSLSVSNYDDSANLVASGSYTATNSTTITETTPTQLGSFAVIVRDPTTSQVLGSGLFTHTARLVRVP